MKFKSNKHGTVNRGQLKKLVSLGLLEASCGYRMTDDYAFDASNNFGQSDYQPARLKIDNKDNLEGYANFSDWDFQTSSGMAWINKDLESVTLKIHGNESWQLRFIK